MMRRVSLQFIVFVMLALLLPASVLAQEADSVSAFEVRWSPDGRWIGVGSTGGVWIFDAEDFDAEPLHYAEDQAVYAVAFDPLRPYAAFAAQDDTQVQVIEIETGAEVFSAATPMGEGEFSSVFYDLGYSDDGQYLSAVNTSWLYVIDAETGERARAASYADPDFVDMRDWLTALDYNDSIDTVLVSDWHGRLLAFEVANRERPEIYQLGIEYGLYRFEILPETDQVLLHGSNALHTYDLTTEALDMLTDPAVLVYGFDLSSDAELVAVGSETVWLLYDLAENSVAAEFESEFDPAMETTPRIYSLAFSPDGDRVVTLQTDGQLKVWDATTGEVLAVLSDFMRGGSQRWG